MQAAHGGMGCMYVGASAWITLFLSLPLSSYNYSKQPVLLQKPSLRAGLNASSTTGATDAARDGR